jgi:hypothetical protein
MKPVVLATLLTLSLCPLTANAGLFLFAESQGNPQLITHPTGYSGGNNQHLEISVCIDTSSESIPELDIPVKNSITVWNELEPTLGNVIQPNPEMDFSAFDVESVILHEIGHCIGLAHPNLGTESGLGDQDHRTFAKALPEFPEENDPVDQYNLNAGADGVIGTRDDLRGGDENLNWFQSGVNDPFGMPAVIDASTYTVDTADLPSSGDHEFVEIAGRFVWQARGLPNTVAVMFQGIFNSETRRELNHDDAAMIRLGMSGTDRTQGTAQDYTYELQYGGVNDNCDITITMQGSSFGFCQVSATSAGLPANHFRIVSANIGIASTSEVNWHFNDQLLDDNLVFQDRFEED